MDAKKRYIYDNIGEINNSKLIFDFIKNNEIEYSKNKNGIYFNIACVDDIIIEKLYTFIISLIDNEIIEEKYTEVYDNLINICGNITKKEENGVKFKYTKIKLSKLQKDILSLL